MNSGATLKTFCTTLEESHMHSDGSELETSHGPLFPASSVTN